MISKLETFFKHWGQRDIILKTVRVNEVDKGKHIPKGDDGVISFYPYFSGQECNGYGGVVRDGEKCQEC